VVSKVRLYTCKAIRKIEDIFVDKYGFNFFQLMDYAGIATAQAVLSRFPDIKSATVLCGGGNNGGDGLVVARQLLLKGISVNVLAASTFEKASPQTTKNKIILEKMGKTIHETKKIGDSELMKLLKQGDVIVDALLGIGAKGAPRGESLRLIRAINQSDCPVVSVDLPSGIDGSTGQVMGEAVRATVTVTFWAPKVGLYVMPGKEYSGEVVVTNSEFLSACLFPDVAGVVEKDLYLIDAPEAKALLPEVPLSTHKGKRGSVLIFAGSKKYKGAAILSSLGALRAGAGRVILVVPEGCCVTGVGPETIVFEVPSMDGALSADSYDMAMDEFGHIVSAIVVGPGVGRTNGVRELVAKIWKDSSVYTCMDADAIYFLPAIMEQFSCRKDNILITPHEGEAARLVGANSAEVSAKRLQMARLIAERYATVLLKGPGTIIDDGKKTAVIKDAHPCLSVPGSGDVLSGVIGAFMARGLGCYESALCSAYLHARAGVTLGLSVGNDGVLASEIAGLIPKEIRKLSQQESNHG